MGKWLRENWTSPLLFIYASAWTAGGIYIAVDVVIGNPSLRTWGQFFELLILLNIAVLVFFYGFKTQTKLIQEWKDDKKLKND